MFNFLIICFLFLTLSVSCVCVCFAMSLCLCVCLSVSLCVCVCVMFVCLCLCVCCVVYSSGMDDYISKPISFSAVQTKIKMWAKQILLYKQQNKCIISGNRVRTYETLLKMGAMATFNTAPTRTLAGNNKKENHQIQIRYTHTID